MAKLSFDEFKRLPRNEQNERYKELSEHDKFLARMNDWPVDEPFSIAETETFFKEKGPDWEAFYNAHKKTNDKKS